MDFVFLLWMKLFCEDEDEDVDPRNPRCVRRKKGDDKVLVDTVGGAQSDVNIVSIFRWEQQLCKNLC